MKAEFELNLDANGKPCIKFRHHDRNNSLEQELLKHFIKGIKEKGMELHNTNGCLEAGTGVSWENYEIRIKQ